MFKIDCQNDLFKLNWCTVAFETPCTYYGEPKTERKNLVSVHT